MQKISAFFINFITQYFYVKHGCRILGEHSPLFFNTSKNLLKLKKKVITFEALYSFLIFQEFLSLFWNTYMKLQNDFFRQFLQQFQTSWDIWHHFLMRFWQSQRSSIQKRWLVQLICYMHASVASRVWQAQSSPLLLL